MAHAWYYHCSPRPPGRRCYAPGRAVIKRSPSLIAPALLLSIAAVAPLSPTIPSSLAVQAAPLLVFGGGSLLGIVMGRGRLVLGLMVLALTTGALMHLGGRTTFQAVALLLPLNLGIVAWLGETRVLSTRGAWWLAAILLQAGAVGIFHFVDPVAVDASIERSLIATDADVWTPLPRLAVFAFVGMLGLHFASFARGGRPLPAGAAWALVASFLALDTAGAGGPADLHLATAGMLLAIGAVLEPPPVVHRDSVTGLPGSLDFNTMVRRLPRRYALACVKIDEFATFREEQGMDPANRMLRRVAKALTKIGGGGRVFYLLRDHAFVVVFRRRSGQTASRHLDIVRRAIEAATMDVSVPARPGAGRKAPTVVQRTVAVTISAGVAEPHRHGADPHEVLREAERALVRAQLAGMNRVVVQPHAAAVTDVEAGPNR